jgi:hypothetical protein
LDTRAGEEAPALGLGIDREMALAIYRVGREDEFAEVFIYKGSTSIISVMACLTLSTVKAFIKVTGEQMSRVQVLNVHEVTYDLIRAK